MEDDLLEKREKTHMLQNALFLMHFKLKSIQNLIHIV